MPCVVASSLRKLAVAVELLADTVVLPFPVMVEVTVSVAVIVWAPLVLSVAEKL